MAEENISVLKYKIQIKIQREQIQVQKLLHMYIQNYFELYFQFIIQGQGYVTSKGFHKSFLCVFYTVNLNLYSSYVEQVIFSQDLKGSKDRPTYTVCAWTKFVGDMFKCEMQGFVQKLLANLKYINSIYYIEKKFEELSLVAAVPLFCFSYQFAQIKKLEGFMFAKVNHCDE